MDGFKTKTSWIITIMLASFVVVTAQCPTGCSYCDNGSENKCTGCLERYRLEGDSCVLCPEKCLNCSADNRCQKCENPYYGILHCNNICPVNCDAHGCDAVNGVCFGCQDKYYGARCDQSCGLCNNSECDRYSCTDGCTSGYYETKPTATDSECLPCPDNCKKCTDNSICFQCVDGYFTANNYLCQVCSDYIPHCALCSSNSSVTCKACQGGYYLQNNACMEYTCPTQCQENCHSNGTCIGACMEGFSGTRCGSSCASKCNSCAQDDRNMCTSCIGDFYTSSCTLPCSVNCIIMIGKDTCNLTGYCNNGCLDGYWGPACSQMCPANCNTCEQIFGACPQCKRSFYGQFCDKMCSNNCLDTDQSGAICSGSGVCLLGSKPGFIGSHCNISRSTSLSTKSITVKDSTTPVAASTETKGSTVAHEALNSESTNDSKNTAVIGGASAGGVVVLGVLIGIGVFCLRQRSRWSRGDKTKQTDGSVENGAVVDSSLSLANSTSKPVDESPSSTYDTPADNIYSQPNKPKLSVGSSLQGETRIENDSSADRNSQAYIYARSHKPRKPLVSEQVVNHENMGPDGTEQLEQTDDEKDFKVVELEDLDEDIQANLEQGDTPSADTYYNKAGLKRSRIMIADLNEYVKEKRDFNTEFEKLPKGLTRTCNEALTTTNRAKNRYRGVYAYDATRVVLQSGEYINANYIDGHDVSSAYIACLGPVKTSMNQFETFWNMVWQENSAQIVMLTNLVEKTKMKCEQYWPEDGSVRQYGDFRVTTNSEKVYAEYIVRELQIQTGNESSPFPTPVQPFWSLGTQWLDRKHQMLDRCAGIGRTGTFIALDILIKEGLTENSVDIFGCVLALRGQRVYMVQNVEQYIYLHHCVLYALTCNPKPAAVTSLLGNMPDSKIQEQFQALQSLPEPPNKDEQSAVANKRKKENRKGADIPGDRHRVKLRLMRNDYINAVYVNGYRHQHKYILAQSPTSNTVEEFLSMLYQEDIAVVVDLEDDQLELKGVGHYISQADKVGKFGHYQVICKQAKDNEKNIFRELLLSKKGEPPGTEKKLKHYQMKCWKLDAHLPEIQTDFLHFLTTVSNPARPATGCILVQCLDGAKKNGLFCALSIMLEKLAAEKELSVVNTVCQVRGSRRTALQDFDQFRFCYRCVQEYLEAAEANTYDNIL